MLSLTTWQRDLLQYLINTGEPLDPTVYGHQLHLTLRQIRYGLREIESWLQRRQVLLVNTPRSGLQIVCTPEQRQRLLAELSSDTKFQLILTPEQRQQLLILSLLVTCNPLILQQLQQDLIVSRMTVLKDLDVVEDWLKNFDLTVERRQHRGCWVEGAEMARRQALAALLWGDVQLGQPIMSVQNMGGIVFALAQDAGLPIVRQVNSLVSKWDLADSRQAIVKAEAELGVRFTEEAITLITLALAIQTQQVRAGQVVEWNAAVIEWVQSQIVWPVMVKLGSQFWPSLTEESRTSETATLALQFLSSARDVAWPHKAGVDQIFSKLITSLMASIGNAYEVPELAHDQMLYDGLDALIMPAYLRQRFGLWTPRRSQADAYNELYTRERTVAARVADEVIAATDIPLQKSAIDELVLLLRAAIIRAQPERTRHILVVCPSGMATTQLLVAQLRARFLHVGTFEVLPMRELSAERIGNADLLITTVPLVLPADPPITVIQVHPLLMSEDITALTQWLG